MVAAGPSSADYEWAIISGGAPGVQGAGGKCRNAGGSITNPNGNGEGLWLFFRDPNPSAALVDQVRGVAADKGFDLTVLVQVQQQGCSYAPFPSGGGAGGGIFGAMSG